jgi:hypothetical protein
MAREIEIIAGYPALGRIEDAFDVPATKVQGTELLWVNNDMELDDKGNPAFRRTWVVTHEPSGWAIARGFTSKASARAAALWFAAIGLEGHDTEDADAVNKALLSAGLLNAKAWLSDQMENLSSDKLIAVLEREARRGGAPVRAAAKRAEPRKKKAAKKKAAKKKATKKKAAKKKAAKKRREAAEPLDFLEAVRLAGEDNPKARLLSW